MTWDTQKIGWVAAVDSERLTIELDPATTGLVKGGIHGVLPIGSINSYLTIPAGPTRIVAVVTAIRLAEDAPKGRESYAAQEALSRRLEAVMVGRLEGSRYLAGVATYPALFSPVASATPDEIGTIFHPGDGPSISVGEAVVAPDVEVRLDANLLLSRHAAILGSTGSGKSCTVTAVIDALLEQDVPAANIIIFDSNGEYSAAFRNDTARGKRANVSAIGPDVGSTGGLFLPMWFMDNEDHLDLLRASEGAQAPLLQRSIVDARLGGETDASLLTRLRSVARSLDDIRSVMAPRGRKPQDTAATAFEDLASSLDRFRDQAADDDEVKELWRDLAEIAGRWESIGLDREAWDVPLSLEHLDAAEAILREISARVSVEFDRLGMGSQTAALDFDAPRYYSLTELHDLYLPHRIERAALIDQRVRGYATTMMMRLSRLLADSRYDFMTRVPHFESALARFLRYITGNDPLKGRGEGDSAPWDEAYSEHGGEKGMHHSVTILDLSRISTDVLENVTALIGRLIMDFAQRVRPRGSLPILIVLEEAHRYIPHSSETRARSVFERIAKEGRKFGLSLVLASQRPSELARTVLAQCGTLIAHRTVNPEDQDLIRHATPFANREVLRQLPGLATQHAIVLGESAPVPSYVRIRTVKDPPMSHDPDFIGRWSEEPTDTDLFEVIAERWEQGQGPPTGGQ